jgi:purine-binding chemotaxis protein CheW
MDYQPEIDAASPREPAAPGNTARQFVTFHIDDSMFAVPLAEVQEIIRMPNVVQVPLSPASLEGLANLRGTVMSITSLRQILRFKQREHDETTRVIVINQGVPIGLVVDRMAAVLTAEPDQIEGVSAIESTINTDLLRGMIKAADGRVMTMILDPGQLFESEFGSSQGRTSRFGENAPDAEAPSAAELVDELQLVSFEVAGQEYALPIESVKEIVQVPERINRIPKTGSHVLGVMTLRNQLLPSVSLRDMFGLPAAPLDDRNKIVVVPLPGENSVGIMMDMVKEVLRVNRKHVDKVPGLLKNGRSESEIQGICRLDGGKRLVCVLSAEALFSNDVIRRAITAGAELDAGNVMAEDDAENSGIVADDEQFVIFRLANEEYGVPIAAVQEIVRVPEEMTRPPKAPAFIKGVVNLRGAVLPVIDQRIRFDLDEIERNDRQRIMVFMIGGIRTGFIVDSVSEVLKIAGDSIGPAPALSEEQTRLICRVANLESKKRIILLIDADYLLDQHESGAVSNAAGITKH